MAAVIEAALLALTFLAVSAPSAPDSPLTLMLAALLQMPSSLVVIGILTVIPSEDQLSNAALWLYAVVMFAGQTLLFGVVLWKTRRPDRGAGSSELKPRAERHW